MPISDKYKAIFIHIPKTAGTSIETVLEVDPYNPNNLQHFSGNQLQHRTAMELKTNMMLPDQVFNNYFKFTFVRNPFDRLYSEYLFLSEQGVINLPFDNFANIDFLTRRDLPGFIVDHTRPQSDYILDSFGNVLVDYIGKFETLSTNWEVISERLNVSKKLPHMNKTKRDTGYRDMYGKKTREAVEKLYNKDLKIFKYHF